MQYVKFNRVHKGLKALTRLLSVKRHDKIRSPHLWHVSILSTVVESSVEPSSSCKAFSCVLKRGGSREACIHCGTHKADGVSVEKGVVTRFGACAAPSSDLRPHSSSWLINGEGEEQGEECGQILNTQ